VPPAVQSQRPRRSVGRGGPWARPLAWVFVRSDRCRSRPRLTPRRCRLTGQMRCQRPGCCQGLHSWSGREPAVGARVCNGEAPARDRQPSPRPLGSRKDDDPAAGLISERGAVTTKAIAAGIDRLHTGWAHTSAQRDAVTGTSRHGVCAARSSLACPRGPCSVVEIAPGVRLPTTGHVAHAPIREGPVAQPDRAAVSAGWQS
jgi:hypothetical protein